MYTNDINNQNDLYTKFMKKSLQYGIALILLSIPLVSSAAEFRLGEQTSITQNERITDDLYLLGGNVTSAGSVVGDVLTGGGTIVISGAVTGDVTAAGGSITILSNITDDVRASGGSIVIQGSVGGDIIAGGGQVTIGGGGVGGDVAVGAGSVRIDAPIKGSVNIGGGSVYLNAPIAGNITVEADTLTLGSQAVINGTLSYKASKILTKEDGATVTGTVTFVERQKKSAQGIAPFALLSAWILGKILALLACSLVVGLIFKRYSNVLVRKVVEGPLLELGRGFVFFATLPVLSILAFVSLIGIPFGFLGLMSFVVALLFAWIVTPIIVGSVVYCYFSKSDWFVSWKTILLGVFLYSIIGIVPILGWLVQALLMLLALGAMVGIKWGVMREWR